MPLHVRAGSIVPIGPPRQHAFDGPDDPVTLFVYQGRDGAFSLYEDDGLTNAYETGAFAAIPLRWDESRRTLTIGARAGEFAGMLKARTFEVVFASAGRPAGDDRPVPADRVVRYDGSTGTVEVHEEFRSDVLGGRAASGSTCRRGTGVSRSAATPCSTCRTARTCSTARPRSSPAANGRWTRRRSG